MSIVRYSLGGDYDQNDSSEAILMDGPFDLLNHGLIQISIQGDGSYYLSNDLGGSTLATNAPLGDRQPIDSYNDGLYADFSDISDQLFLNGGDLGDVMIAGSSDDTLKGGGGSDFLEGGLGENYLYGGSGINTISYEHMALPLNAGMTVDLNNGYANDLFDASTVNDSLSGIQNVIGSAFSDEFYGSSDNNVFEGGAGADGIHGGGGIDTASYSRSASGVNVDLTSNDNTGGDAEGDLLFDISKILGSTFADTLTGNNLANTLTGNGGGDALYGMDGSDRLVIADTPTMIDGGTGTDFLFVKGGGSVSLTESIFTGIEVVYIRNGTTLDMSEVTTGTRIVSQSTSDHGSQITGTTGSDRIQAGRGGDTIEGGTGGDKLFAGAGSDTFHFQAGFGRDNLYGFDVATDHITVDIAGIDAADIEMSEFHGGRDTLVTFAGVGGVNKLILHDVTVAELQAGPGDLFTFGA